MERLILFDIDGTLTRTQNGYLPFNEAILQTFGVAGDIRTVVPDGNTDPLIVKDIFAKAHVRLEISDEHWSRFTANLHSCYERHLQQGSIAVQALPGALELLQALSDGDGLGASVVTGNFELTAQVKLQAAGLLSYLARGAYASDSAYRSDLPAIAKDRWQRLVQRNISFGDCVVIGDTPNDLAAARQNGMKCVLVGTGRYPVEELGCWRPDVCLADLSDTEAVLTALADL